jgi:nicotinamide riboside transporter PnuC
MIERKLTLAVVFAVTVQTAGVFLWAGAATERLNQVETRVAAQADTAERLARVEVRLQIASAQLDCIEKKVDAR